MTRIPLTKFTKVYQIKDEYGLQDITLGELDEDVQKQILDDYEHFENCSIPTYSTKTHIVMKLDEHKELKEKAEKWKPTRIEGMKVFIKHLFVGL